MRRYFALLIATFFLTVSCSPSRAAEEKTVNAIAAIEGVGQAYQIAPDKALFLGGFAGTIFVEDGVGALNAGQIVCPGSVGIELESGRQAGSGHCIITNAQGDRVFANWYCEGIHTIGCEGYFEVVGGTNGYTGISGKGKFVFRSALRDLVIDALRGEATEAVLGVAVWQDFTYKIP